MTAAPQSIQPIAERLRHVCPETDCIYYGKPTTPGSCGCHTTLDQMMLARIKALEAVLTDAQRIIERDFPNGQLAIDIRAALKPAGETGA